MARYLTKIVGGDKANQAAFLQQHLRRLYPRGTHLTGVIDEFHLLPDYSTLDKKRRYNFGRQQYKCFDKLLEKLNGTTNPSTQRKFINSRFKHIHNEFLIKAPSWRQVITMIKQLTPENPTPYSSLSDTQKKNLSVIARKVIKALVKT